MNALNHQNFQPGQFDIQGIVPVGYALFAVALGIAAGTLLRRTLPALVITIGVFAALRIVISEDLRSHYMTAVTMIYTFLHRPALPTGSYWLVSGGLVGPGGQVPSSQVPGGPHLSIGSVPISISNMPSACRALVFQSSLKFFPCLTAHGYRELITYQPASRYWAFQAIETGIFVLLAAALIAIAVTRRDA